MRLSVAITVRNDRANMVDLLASLANQERPPDELVIVDAFSTDGTWEVIEGFAFAAPFRVLAVQEAGSRGAGRSRCVELATGDAIVFIDSDCTVPRDWLLRFEQGWRDESRKGEAPLGALGAPNQTPPGSSPLQYAIDDVMAQTEAASFHGVNTCNCVYLKSALVEAGLFDKALHTAEDPDVNARIAKLGYRLTRVDNPCWHKRRDGWRVLLRQHYAYGKGGWALLRRHPEYFPAIERWVAPVLAAGVLAGLLLAILAHPLFALVSLAAVTLPPLVVHRRMAFEFLRRYGPGRAWLRRLGVLWAVYIPYHAGILSARLQRES